MQEGSPSINTQDPAELGRLVQAVDPSLAYIRDLNPHAKGCRTLLVNQDGKECVLKVRHPSANIWDDTYFHYEILALKRVGERQLSDVVRLVREYETEIYHAILKTYAEGTPCNTVDHKALLQDPAFIEKLDALYLKLHLAGIAKVQFQPRKVVMRPDGGLTLVDLNTCLVNTEVGIQSFSQEMRMDSRFITRLEKAARKAGSSPQAKTKAA